MPEFYLIIARKIFFPEFWGGGARAPLCSPSLTPMKFFEAAYERMMRIIVYIVYLGLITNISW